MSRRLLRQAWMPVGIAVGLPVAMVRVSVFGALLSLVMSVLMVALCVVIAAETKAADRHYVAMLPAPVVPAVEVPAVPVAEPVLVTDGSEVSW